MTEKEQMVFDEYGTAYPCCGNCEFIREAGFRLMCREHLEYREYSSVKCIRYKFHQRIDKLEELNNSAK